jgi:hypothetical protein
LSLLQKSGKHIAARRQIQRDPTDSQSTSKMATTTTTTNNNNENTSEEKAVLDAIDALLSCLPSKDVSKALEVCLPSGGTATMRGTELSVQPIQNLIEFITTIPGPVEERFIDPEVRIYEDLAMVWSKNEVKLDGNVISVGMNVISLHKIEGRWKITSIADTAKPPA